MSTCRNCVVFWLVCVGLLVGCGGPPAAEEPAEDPATTTPTTVAEVTEPTAPLVSDADPEPPTTVTTAPTTVAEVTEPTRPPTGNAEPELPTATAEPELPTATAEPEPTLEPRPEPATVTAEPTPIPNLYKGVQQGFTDDGIPALGSPDAPLLLTDYSDFLCPACQAYVLTIEPQLIETYVRSGQLRLAFRPVLNHGERSVSTSEAAQCAAQQDQFWPMHDLLFNRLDEVWATTETAMQPLMIGYASELDLDVAAFEQCLAEGTARQQVLAWDAEQRSRGITVQPTFEVGSQRFFGAPSFAFFQGVIDQELAAATQ